MASMPVFLPSPYIVQSSGHVTEAEMDTVETANAYGIGPDVVVVRAHYHRLTYGATGERVALISDTAPDNFNSQDLPAAYSSDRHLFVTTSDYEHDVTLYKELRYSGADFAYLNTDSNINRVIDSGDARVYLIAGKGNESESGLAT